jgi:hypothetical protein
LKNLLRPPVAADGRPTVPAALSETARGRLQHAVLAGLFALSACLPASALAASGERVGGASLPGAKAGVEALTYDAFVNSTCSQAGFFTDATAHLDISGDVVLGGVTTLDGAHYDEYTLPVPGGPDVFPTKFFRDFAPPPPASSTWTFVFRSHVYQGGRRLGTSQTTITCTNGVFGAVNAWIPEPEPIPAGGPLGLGALALLLAAVAVRRLALRRA